MIDTSTDLVSLIISAEYGRCVVTDAPLLAYGTFSYDSWNGSWRVHWTRDRAEAEYLHEELCRVFAEVCEHVTCDAFKKRIGEFYGAYGYNREFPEDLRTRMANTYYGYSSGATTVVEMEMLIAEVEAAVEELVGAERRARGAKARREAAEVALQEMEHPEAHIWVPANGDIAYVLAGKTSKAGRFSVIPDAGDTVLSGLYCFGDSKYQWWVPFRFDVRSRVQDFSGAGNLQSQVTLFVPKGLLAPGVYGVAEDDEGQFFLPVIHHYAGEEVIPEVSAIQKIRALKESSSKSFAKQVEGGDSQEVSFTEIGNRTFRCACGGIVQVIKSTWKSYQSGEMTHLSCSSCGAGADIVKTVGSSSSKTDQLVKKSESVPIATPAEKLAQVWSVRRR